MGPYRASFPLSSKPIGIWLEQRLKQEGFLRVVGLDEAGRGPLAGPVVAAAVILPPGVKIAGLKDSKKLTLQKRERLCHKIKEVALGFALATVGPEEIDELNIHRASLKAMALAGAKLYEPRDVFIVDGPFKVPLDFPQVPVTKGDSLIPSVSAASILAKVTRDALMDELHELYPLYGFNRHRGYPTKTHREAIARFGPSPIHRRSFKGVKEFL